MFYDGGMVFVRWHYRDGVYVCSHHRRRRLRPGSDQTSLLPALLLRPAVDDGPAMRPGSQDAAPARVLPGQCALPIALGS